jgi:hypothetical protein
MGNHNLGRPAKHGISAITAGVCSGAVAVSMAAMFFVSLGTAAVSGTAATSVTAIVVANTATTASGTSGDPWG